MSSSLCRISQTFDSLLARGPQEAKGVGVPKINSLAPLRLELSVFSVLRVVRGLASTKEQLSEVVVHKTAKQQDCFYKQKPPGT